MLEAVCPRDGLSHAAYSVQCACLFVCVCVCVCVHVHVYVCMFVCLCAWLCVSALNVCDVRVFF